jgi:hypothetical protein
VGGDSYEELARKADNTISKFLASEHDEDFEDDEEQIDQPAGIRINYELLVTMSEDISSEYEYVAEVIAKIRE